MNRHHLVKNLGKGLINFKPSDHCPNLCIYESERIDEIAVPDLLLI